MKKIIMPLIITLFMILLVLSLGLTVILEENVLIVGKFITSIIVITIIVLIIKVFIERIMEIREEDEDDLSKY